MEEKQLLSNVIDTLTDTPLYTFKAQVKPRRWYNRFRKPKEKTYIINRISGGNAYRISRKILEIPEAMVKKGSDSVLRDMYQLFINHLNAVAYIVAVGIVNSREEPPASLIDELVWNVEEKELRRAAIMLVRQFNISDFTSTIVLIAGMDIITTKASPQVPGELSEAL